MITYNFEGIHNALRGLVKTAAALIERCIIAESVPRLLWFFMILNNCTVFAPPASHSHSFIYSEPVIVSYCVVPVPRKLLGLWWIDDAGVTAMKMPRRGDWKNTALLCPRFEPASILSIQCCVKATFMQCTASMHHNKLHAWSHHQSNSVTHWMRRRMGNEEAVYSYIFIGTSIQSMALPRQSQIRTMSLLIKRMEMELKEIKARITSRIPPTIWAPTASSVLGPGVNSFLSWRFKAGSDNPFKSHGSPMNSTL